MRTSKRLLLVVLALVLTGCLDRKPVRTAATQPEARTWLTNEENGAITYGPAPESYGDVLPKPKDVGR